MGRPTVTAVIATRGGRPEMLRRALRGILEQRCDADLEVVVVFDQTEPDPLDDVVVPPERTLRSIANTRTPGLAGGRNSGILAATGTLVAFCDDDDEWMPGKLAAQLPLIADPGVALVASGIRIQTDGPAHDRVPPPRVGTADLLESRITELHPSAFLMRRADLVDGFGLVDEALPASFGEDYDLLLRAAGRGDIVSALDPLVIVHWNRASYFTAKWAGMAAGLTYLLEKHPRFAESSRGSARIEGQIAFAHAALGDRPAARAWARRALAHRAGELRAHAAHAVAIRLVSPATLVRMVNRRGRGV